MSFFGRVRGTLRRISILAVLFLSLAFASCSRRQLPSSSTVAVDREMQVFLGEGAEKRLNTGRTKPNEVIRTAEKFMGTPHCMGGTTPRCMDCSGLTYTSFSAHNISLPRRSQDQARYGRIVFSQSDLRRGDLVFFTRSYNTSDYITHVGIYLGKIGRASCRARV